MPQILHAFQDDPVTTAGTSAAATIAVVGQAAADQPVVWVALATTLLIPLGKLLIEKLYDLAREYLDLDKRTRELSELLERHRGLAEKIDEKLEEG